MEFVNIADTAVRTELLQEMLRYLAYIGGDYESAVTVTGVYNAETEEAVRRYQEERKLPVTGIVDAATWNAIANEYRREREIRKPVYMRVIPNDAAYATAFGERSDEVLILQIMLNALRINYDYPAVPLSGIYGAQTRDAVRAFQSINGLSDTGIADRETWGRIVWEYNRLYD